MEEHLPGRRVRRLLAAVTTLPLLLVLLLAYRVLYVGTNLAFTRPDVQGGFFPRAATFVLFSAPDRVLVVPLVSLAVLAWLAHAHRVANRVAAGLAAWLAAEAALVAAMAGYVFWRTSVPDAGIDLQGQRLQALGPALAVSLLVACVAGVLGAALVRAPVREPEQEQVEEPDADPYAAFRGPGSEQEDAWHR